MSQHLGKLSLFVRAGLLLLTFSCQFEFDLLAPLDNVRWYTKGEQYMSKSVLLLSLPYFKHNTRR